MSGRMKIEDLELSFSSLETKFERLIQQYEETGADTKLHQAFNLAVKSFRADVDSFMRICHTLAPDLEIKFSLLHLMSASFGQEGIDNSQTIIQNPALSTTTKTELLIDQKAKKLAELLFACLDPNSKSLDNPVAFIGKMKIFPRTTAVSGNINDTLKANVRKTLEMAVIQFGIKLNQHVNNMQTANASVRAVNNVRADALQVYKSLIANENLELGPTVRQAIEKTMNNLESDMHPELIPSVFKPKPPGAIS